MITSSPQDFNPYNIHDLKAYVEISKKKGFPPGFLPDPGLKAPEDWIVGANKKIARAWFDYMGVDVVNDPEPEKQDDSKQDLELATMICNAADRCLHKEYQLIPCGHSVHHEVNGLCSTPCRVYGHDGHCVRFIESQQAVIEKKEVAKKPSALDRQVGGSHYKIYKIQPYEFFLQNQTPHHKASIIRRILRYDHPTGHGIVDLQKIVHEVELIIEIEGLT